MSLTNDRACLMDCGKSDAERFLTEIKRLSEERNGSTLHLIATGLTRTGAVVIVYRENAKGPLLGRIFDYTKFSRMFDPAVPEQIAEAVLINDLIDPSGSGRKLGYEWETSFTGSQEPVQWLEYPIGQIISEVFANESEESAS